MSKKAVFLAAIVSLTILGCFALSGCQTQSPQSDSASSKASTHPIRRVSFHYNFAEVGDGWSYELVRSEGDEDVLYLSKIPSSTSGREANQFSCADSVLDNIEGICESYGIYDWPETLEDNPVQYADRSEKLVEIEYEDGQKRTFSTQDALPDGGKAAIEEIAKVLGNTVDID